MTLLVKVWWLWFAIPLCRVAVPVTDILMAVGETLGG